MLYVVVLQSVVKSHLDAIPEDRKAIEKGGGNAVQKLHEVEKYIRKNKLKVFVHMPDKYVRIHCTYMLRLDETEVAFCFLSCPYFTELFKALRNCRLFHSNESFVQRQLQSFSAS